MVACVPAGITRAMRARVAVAREEDQGMGQSPLASSRYARRAYPGSAGEGSKPSPATLEAPANTDERLRSGENMWSFRRD